MDIQMLMRLDRMPSPRMLTLSADVAAAKRLVESGMIEASVQIKANKRSPALGVVMHVLAVTPEGMSAIALEKGRR